MKTFMTLLSIGLLTAISYFPAAAQSGEGMAWNSFDKGLELAKNSNKKVLIDIYTDWCGWCKKMDSDVYTNSAVAKYLTDNFVIVKLNAEGDGTVHYKGQAYSHGQIAASFGASGYPTTVFLNENGDPITRLPGYVEAPMFLNILSYIAENQFQHEGFDAYLKQKSVTP